MIICASDEGSRTAPEEFSAYCAEVEPDRKAPASPGTAWHPSQFKMGGGTDSSSRAIIKNWQE